MKFRDIDLSTRITLAGLLLVMAGGALWIYDQNQRLHEAYLTERAADLGTALQVQKSHLVKSIETLRQDVLFLADTPPVSGLIRARSNHGFDPRDKNSYATWEARLKGIFVAFLRAHPDYAHARFIGVANGGRELVRVNVQNGYVEIVPHDKLQAKGDRDFFKSGLALGRGQVRLSEFNLEQEWGKITEPYHPTLRAVTPVFDAQGRLFGMVVLNIDTPPLFADAVAILPAGVQGYIADQQGHYLLHPDAKRAFTFELGGKEKITEDFPLLSPLFGSRTQNNLPLQALNSASGGYMVAERVYFDADDATRFLMMAYYIPSQLVSRQTYDIYLTNIVKAVFVLILLSIVFMLALRRALSPLKNIAIAAGEIAAGNHQLRLQVLDNGEIGKLAAAINTMLDKLSKHDVIEQENAFRKELIESLPGIFYMFDTRGKFLMWNHNLEVVMGMSADEISASNPLDFFEETDKRLVEYKIGEVFSKGEVTVEATLLTKNGQAIPYHFTGRRVLRNDEPVLIGMGLDIAEQRASMRVTVDILRRNQALMQNSMDGVHVMGMDGNLFEVNDTFCRMLGYSREELMRLNVRDWDCQFSAEEITARFKALIGKNAIFDTVHRRKDGSLLDVEICANGVEIDGECYLFASSRDITERKKAQSLLQRHKQVIETAHDGYWLTDIQGNVLEVNEAYAAISGYTVQELVGMHISQLEAKEVSLDEVKAHIAKIIANGYDVFETRHRHKDGHEIEIEVSSTYLKDTQQFVVFSRDISERKLADTALRVAAAAFETHDAILITDAQANIIRVNHAFVVITGYAANEVIGKNPRMMSSGRQDHAFYAAMWGQLLEAGQWAGEIWDRRKNGEIYPKWLTITAVKNEAGITLQYVAIFSDITERKQAEDEIRSLAFYDALTQLPNRRLGIAGLGALQRLRCAFVY